MPITLAATHAMFLLGYAVLQLSMAWDGHVDQPSPQQEFTQVLLGIHDAVATSGIVKSIGTDEEEENKPKASRQQCRPNLR